MPDTLTLDTPTGDYVADSEVDINGTTSPGVDEVVIYASPEDTNADYLRITTISVDGDDTFSENEFNLVEDADNPDALNSPGPYRIATLDADSSELDDDGDGVPDNIVSRSEVSAATGSQTSLQVVDRSVTFTDTTVQTGTDTITVDSASVTTDGETDDYVVVVHEVGEEYDDGVSAPVGASADQTGSAENIQVELNDSSAAFEDDDALDSLTEDTTLRAMLHESNETSAFGDALMIDGELVTDDANVTVQDEAPEDEPPEDEPPEERFDQNGMPGIQEDEVLEGLRALGDGTADETDVLDLLRALADS